jgi:hypothetical protein
MPVCNAPAVPPVYTGMSHHRYLALLEQFCFPDNGLRREALRRLLPPHELQQDGVSTNLVVPARAAQFITLAAHYDTFPGSMGYYDNGTGVAVLLDLLPQLPPWVEVVFTDNEEHVGLGAQLYCTLRRPLATINVDVVGHGKTLQIERFNGFPYAIPDGQVNELRDVPFSDSTIFAGAGIPGLLIIAGNGGYDEVIGDIFLREHNNKLDNRLDSIDPRTMELAYRFLHDLVAAAGRHHGCE